MPMYREPFAADVERGKQPDEQYVENPSHVMYWDKTLLRGD